MITDFHQRVTSHLVPLLQVIIYNMNRVYGGDVSVGVEAEGLPGHPPPSYHGGVVAWKVHLEQERIGEREEERKQEEEREKEE